MPKKLVRSTIGEPLLCCWDDCGQFGDDRIKHVVVEKSKEPGGEIKAIHYIFCSVGHRDFWKHRDVSYGNHSSDNRTPFGLILPRG